MSRRTRYQQGSVQREKRQNGPDVWIFRWREVGADGNSKYRKAIVGTVATLSNEASALKAALALRIDANQQTPQAEGGPSTVSDLIAHYRLKELVNGDKDGKAYSTRAAYECYLKVWITPRWGTHRLDQVKSVAVEDWLRSIKRAKGTKAKIRNIMSALFTHAMRYEWTDRNPMQLVRQSAKREKIPDVLELHELKVLLEALAPRERTLALLDAATGLRVSELLALRWDDIDFQNLEIRVTEAIWHQVLGVCKTEGSARPVPMDSYMAEDLLRWRKLCPYPMDSDWVFASPTMQGKQPYWPDNLMKRYIKPAARQLGINKNIGWHTFRHSFGTILKANGEDVKTVQELLRHANSRITLDVYTQAVNSHKRAAQSKVVKMMVPNLGETKGAVHPQTAQ
jgi:integrase